MIDISEADIARLDRSVCEDARRLFVKKGEIRGAHIVIVYSDGDQVRRMWMPTDPEYMSSSKGKDALLANLRDAIARLDIIGSRLGIMIVALYFVSEMWRAQCEIAERQQLPDNLGDATAEQREKYSITEQVWIQRELASGDIAIYTGAIVRRAGEKPWVAYFERFDTQPNLVEMQRRFKDFFGAPPS